MSVKSFMGHFPRLVHASQSFRIGSNMPILPRMAHPAKSSFEIRAAQVREAAAICSVLRRSIIELCVLDHQNNPARLEEWLANKTPENVASWIADPDHCLFVAAAGQTVLAVGGVRASGEITLNYVSPDGRFRGVSRAMLRQLEQTVRELGLSRATLTSTLTAHDFYLAAGYADCGTKAYETGDWPRMEKAIA
jgi:GNAT superfamily N-acetyltransferase